MGEIPTKATINSDRAASAHAHQVLQDFFAMFSIGTAIRAITTGRMPLKMLTTTGLSLNPENTIAIASIMMNDGITAPRVAARLPFNPLIRYPAKMEMFTAMIPGADCERATMSGSSSSEIHPRLESSRCIRGIMAYPPPMVNAPILAKTPNNCQRDAVFTLS